jgi:hypothetical protein
MIKILKPHRGTLLRPEIDRLIEDFGRWDVLRAAFLAVFHRERPLPDAGELPTYLRRDIGLPPVDVARDWRMLR